MQKRFHQTQLSILSVHICRYYRHKARHLGECGCEVGRSQYATNISFIELEMITDKADVGRI